MMDQDESPSVAQSKQHIGGIFDRAATSYDRVGPQFFSHFGKRLVDTLEIPAGSRVLDVATGRGALLFPASEAVGQHGQVVGIDLAETMVQETSKELVHLQTSSNIELRQMDAEHLEFPDASFDYVLCGFAIFFFPQLDRAMSESYRVLKPNGRICVSTFDKLVNERWSWFDEIVKVYLPPEPEPESNQSDESSSTSQPVFDTPEGLKSILDNAGFIDPQIFSEAKDFVYATNEEFWLSLWSHGKRGELERIEKVKGTDGLEDFKSDVFRQLDVLKEDDGLHQLFSVLIGLGDRPQDRG